MKTNNINMMKRIIAVFLLLMSVRSEAQLNNSWIDYGKTYYKFYIGKDSLCRIPQSALSAAGLGTANVAFFQLWRNGKEVRIYTSVPTGTLGFGDYIEFWGEMNDGKSDKKLYREQQFQIADRYSLETDTAAYFLTLNTAGNNLRFIDAVNPSPGAGPADAYFMRKIDLYYRNQINRGRAEVVGEYVYSSSYDVGEGWASFDIAPCCDFTQELFNLNVYTAGPANSLSVRAAVAGNAPNARSVRVKLFGNTVYDNIMNFFGTAVIDVNNLPLSLLSQPPSHPQRFFGQHPPQQHALRHSPVTRPMTIGKLSKRLP